MKHIIHIIKHFPISIFIMAGIWVICLIPIPETPVSHISMMDKWVHVSVFSILGICLWYEYLKCHKNINKKRLLLFGFLAPLLMGGLIEIVQSTCTGGNRSGDWLDFAADSIGVFLSMIIGILLAKYLSKRKTDS